MPDTQAITDDASFRITVSDDRLTATLIAAPSIDVPAAAVIATLKSMGIIRFDDGELIEALDARDGAALNLVVARGTAPVDERAGRIDFRLPLPDPETGHLAKVTAGQSIAIANDAVPGSDGADVFNQPLPRKKAPLLTPGPGTDLLNGTLTATTPGSLRVHDNCCSVHPLLELASTDDALKSPLTFDGDVSLRGPLPEGRSLTLTGSLLVNGAIEAACFTVGSWAHVKGGIVGRDKGVGTVAGDLFCRFATSVTLAVAGDLHLLSDLAHCRVSCTGRVHLPHGSISGGELTANGGVACHTLGSPSGTPTLVEAGSDHTLRALAAQLKPIVDASQTRITTIRQKIAPLMQNLKSLTPQQKEKATELLYEADELEAATDKQLADLTERSRRAAERARPEIIVAGVIHPGVVISFPGAKAVITTALQGPVTLTTRKRGALTEVVLQEPNGTTCPLPSTPSTDHLALFIKHLTDLKRAA